MRALLIYPSLLDCLVVWILHALAKHVLEQPDAIWWSIILVAGARIVLTYTFVGLALSTERNWYIKQMIYALTGIAVAYLYAPRDFTFVVGVFFATASLSEIIVALFGKRIA